MNWALRPKKKIPKKYYVRLRTSTRTTVACSWNMATKKHIHPLTPKAAALKTS
jgi:hypothetical protein